MDSVAKFNTIEQYNSIFGLKTLHPLVSIIDYSKIKIRPSKKSIRVHVGFYMMFLKEAKMGSITYGFNNYDYDEGTLVFIGPGQVYGVNPPDKKTKPKGYALLFHPDLLNGTNLGKKMKEYSFFSYHVNEALHLSERERGVVVDSLTKILFELEHSIDKHSNTLMLSYIELLLNYCNRFYDRQFITRSQVNKSVLASFEEVLNEYLNSGMPINQGLPSVKYCADKLHLSANYLGDLMKKETGKSAQENIQFRLMDLAKQRIIENDKSVSEIAYELGFRYPQHFSRMFKKRVGLTPNEYRNSN